MCDISGLKEISAKDSGEKKKRMMSIEVKQEILENMRMVCGCLNWQGSMTTVHLQFVPSLNKRMQ